MSECVNLSNELVKNYLFKSCKYYIWELIVSSEC